MYNFIDVEASGLGIGSYPIEVGVALASGNKNCTLVYPPHHWDHWDGEAERLHGITRETLLVNGRSVLKVALLLNEWLRNQTVYSDAWGNDSCWLARLFAEAGVTQRFRIDSVASLLSPDQLDQWHTVKAQVINELDIQRHRASNDAWILQRTVERLYEQKQRSIDSHWQQCTA